MPVCLRLCSAEKSAGRKSGGRFSFLPAAGGYAVFRVVFGRRVAPDGRGTQPPPAEFCFCRKQRPSVLGAAEGIERGGQGTICPLLAVVKNLFWQQAKTLPPEKERPSRAAEDKKTYFRCRLIFPAAFLYLTIIYRIVPAKPREIRLNSIICNECR